MSAPLHILSLGAGVQSSTLALMAAAGEITPMPTCAIFADTQAEPASVYRWLDWLEKQLPFAVHRVTAGNIEEDFLRALGGGAERSRCGQPPFSVKQPNSDDAGGRLWRQCTKEYKLAPIRREVQRLRNGQPVVQWIGISTDEAHRMKPSGVGYITNRWPLIDERMSRHDCLRWLARHGFPEPPKSACRWCPYISDARWRQIKRTEPGEFALATAFDAKLRSVRVGQINGVKITGEVFVHRSCVPLADVDFATDVDRGQGDLFGNECEGMCGV